MGEIGHKQTTVKYPHILVGILLCCSTIAQAEIEKIAIPSPNGFRFLWWLKLPPIQHWHQDKEQSYANAINALAPEGTSFRNAEAVIYARAIYKPSKPELRPLNALIERDKGQFRQEFPDLIIEETTQIATGDGQLLRSIKFSPTKSGNWEQVSYGEEEDYYLIFTLSSRSSAGFEAALVDYKLLLAMYKK